MVPYDPVPWSGFMQAIGLNPTWEAVLAQVAVAAVALGTIAWTHLAQRRTLAQSAEVQRREAASPAE